MILSGTTTDELPFGIDCIDCPQETEPGNTITNRLMGEKDRGDGMPVSPLVHETKPLFAFWPSRTALFDRAAPWASYAEITCPDHSRAARRFTPHVEDMKSMNASDPATSTSGLLARPYQPDWYVERVMDQRNIEQLMQFIQMTGKRVQDMVIYLWNLPGSGRTWLLRHFKDQYQRSNSQESAYPSFSLYYQFDASNENLLKDFIQSIYQQIREQFEAEVGMPIQSDLDQLDFEDAFKLLRETINGLVSSKSKRCFIFLLDDIDLADRALWQQIENHLLKSMLDLPCILVTTSQEQDPDWLHHEIWRRISEMKATPVQPFSTDEAVTLIRRSGYDVTQQQIEDMILPVYCSSPLLVDNLARTIDTWNQEKDTGRHVTYLADRENELSTLIKRYLDSLVPSNIQKELSAVYPLRYYEERSYQYMTTALEQSQGHPARPLYGNELSNLVSEHRIIWRDINYKAYVTHPTVRHLVDTLAWMAQLSGKNASYSNLHNTAIQMYWEKARITPKISEKFLREIIFHCAKLLQIKHEIEQINEEIDAVIRFARSQLVSTRLSALREAIAKDQEIAGLLPEQQYKGILQQLSTVAVI
jgi:hypothetical protein